MSNKINRLLLTGATGGLGKVLRPRLATLANTLRVSDISNLGDAGPKEELIPCDLGDLDAMLALLAGVDAVVHLGGMSIDGPFEPILNANIRGVYNLYEAARKSGTKRIIFASSNHVVGFHKQSERLDADALLRPDGNYGISKAYGEATAQYYFDRFGMETVSLRIGSSLLKPKDRRMMSTWLSFDDLTSLITCALHAPNVGHTIVYGASNNKHTWWDNSKAAHLGWAPKDSSEPFRAEMEATAVHLAADDLAMQYQGGGFVKLGPFPSK